MNQANWVDKMEATFNYEELKNKIQVSCTHTVANKQSELK